MKDETMEAVAESASHVRVVAGALLDEGVPPGILVAAFMRVIWDIMKVQDMSEMQISNQLYSLVDGIREQAYEI